MKLSRIEGLASIFVILMSRSKIRKDGASSNYCNSSVTNFSDIAGLRDCISSTPLKSSSGDVGASQMHHNNNPTSVTKSAEFDHLYSPASSQDIRLKSDDSLKQAYQWYQQFLEARIRESWLLVASSGLAGLGPDLDVTKQTSMIFSFVGKIASVFQTEQMVVLAYILDGLFNDGAFVACEDGGHNGLFQVRSQLVFAAIGWLSMLYKPAKDPQQGRLQIQMLDTHSRPTGFDDCPLQTTSTDLNSIDHPICFLLENFGSLMPPYPNDRAEPRDESPSPQVILVSFICFSTLHGVADVRIEWVDTLNLHLEFDRERHVLKLFRFPSFCLLMYQSKTETVPGRLMSDNWESRGIHTIDYSTKEYFREILLTYRLIFGQDRKSPLIFEKQIDGWRKSGQMTENEDPLLSQLCGNHWPKEAAFQFYENLRAPSISPYYYQEEFPLFSRRILSLQKYMQTRSPQPLKQLWHDRRSVSYWWTFWAVLITGSLTITVSILQLLFNVWTLVRAQSIVGSPQHDDEGGHEGSAVSQNILYFYIATAVILGVYFSRNSMMKLIGQFVKDEARPGLSRIRSRCQCGKSLKDDFLELQLGAAAEVERDLNGEFADPEKIDFASIDEELQSDKPRNSRSLPFIQRMRDCIFARSVPQRERQSVILKYTTKREEISQSTDSYDPLYLLVCIDTNTGSPRLVQLEVGGSQSDRVLFSQLRTEYYSRRGKWLAFLSFRCLREIRFVQFELWDSGEVDIQDYSDRRILPPPSRLEEYMYEPVPAQLIPPIGSSRLLHFFKCLDHPDSQLQNCWRRFPKRRRERLVVDPSGTIVGWGIHLAEGPNLVLIWSLIFTLVLLGGLVFAVTYTVLDHDIQSAFAISSYVISFATLSMGGCSILSRKITRFRSAG